MNELILKGKTEVSGMKFHNIEGGFGEGKKAILIKDIANIHNKGIREINQAINMNIKRFKKAIDYVDLKDTEFAISLIDSGIYTQNSINASKNIYLLSERGYSKLLKILEDDVAWEQYEKLVDGYFNLRKTAIDKTNIDRNEIMLLNAKTRMANTYLKLAQVDTLSSEYKNILVSKASEVLAGQAIIPLPKLNSKTMTADEVGKVLGISANKVGRIANAKELKTSQFGEYRRDKSKYSSKEVDTFIYYPNIVDELKRYI